MPKFNLVFSPPKNHEKYTYCGQKYNFLPHKLENGLLFCPTPSASDNNHFIHQHLLQKENLVKIIQFCPQILKSLLVSLLRGNQLQHII